MQITFSGPNGVGKTTLIIEYAKHLRSQGYTVELFKCPDYTTDSGKIINSKVRNKLHPDDLTTLYLSNIIEVEQMARKIEADIKIFDRGRLDCYVYGTIRGSRIEYNNPNGDLQIVLISEYHPLYFSLIDRDETRPEVFQELNESIKMFKKMKDNLWFH